MEIEGYEEINEREYNEIYDGKRAYFKNPETDETNFFKKIQKFPIVFEDKYYKFEIFEDIIKIIAKNTSSIFEVGYKESFPLLVKAIEKAKEVMKK